MFEQYLIEDLVVINCSGFLALDEQYSKLTLREGNFLIS